MQRKLLLSPLATAAEFGRLAELLTVEEFRSAVLPLKRSLEEASEVAELVAVDVDADNS